MKLRELPGRPVESFSPSKRTSPTPTPLGRPSTEPPDLLGGLDIVVSNAGICVFTPFLEIDDENWHRNSGVNLDGGFYVGQQAARRMIQAGRGGRIVFTTSIGAFRSAARQTHYCASKGGLHLLAQGMALGVGPAIASPSIASPRGGSTPESNDEASRDPAIR